MKKIVIITLALLIGAALSAQQKGDTGIRLTTEYGTIMEAVSGILETLADAGIGVESVDMELGIVNGAVTSTKRATTTIQPRFLVTSKDGKILITATGTGNAGASPTLAKTMGGNAVVQVVRDGQKGSILLSQWETLEELALKVPHTEVKYINPNPPEKKRK